jgi:hypothetical protein
VGGGGGKAGSFGMKEAGPVPVSLGVAGLAGRRAFSPREVWKREIDLESEIVRSKTRGFGGPAW